MNFSMASTTEKDTFIYLFLQKLYRLVLPRYGEILFTWVEMMKF